MELLAPAGDYAAFKMALRYGADAVYLGLKSHNARIKAGNFDADNLPDIIKEAHHGGARVYLTFNTVIKESELSRAADAALSAFSLGADALIVQDLGLVSELKRRDSGIVLHASTQMGIHNAEGAAFAKSLGISRVILSRETPLSEVTRIREKTGLEVEMFAHGALCVAFSGNCYFSGAITGSSGNRGRCLQFCRKSYKCEVGGKRMASGYLLSPADICLAGRLRDLAAAGVGSIKIEGRLRRAEYVGEAVRTYRKILDSGRVDEDDIFRLKSIYNRGNFSEGYLGGNNDRIIYPQHQGHLGVFAGTVVSAGGKDLLNVTAALDFADGDAFKIMSGGIETGNAVCNANAAKGATVRIRYKGLAKPGDKLMRTTSAAQLKSINGGKL